MTTEVLDELRRWLDMYQKNVVPPKAGEIQRKETTQAFMAGAYSMFSLISGPVAAMGEADAVAQLNKVRDYFDTYIRDLKEH